MKIYFIRLIPVLLCFGFVGHKQAAPVTITQTTELKIVFIRHGEKPESGNNLTCKGLNRSLLLPAVIEKKFGTPDFVYVPALVMGDKTSRARMFETITPMAVKHNLDINSKFDENDYAGIANDIRQKSGTVLVVWEHKAISGILNELGIQDTPKWKGDDFNTILIVMFHNGKAILTEDTEGLNPADDCP